MEKKIKIANYFFMISMISWIITLAVTPVGGWHESNPWREYYMSVFCVTGVLTLVSAIIVYKVEKLNR